MSLLSARNIKFGTSTRDFVVGKGRKTIYNLAGDSLGATNSVRLSYPTSLDVDLTEQDSPNVIIETINDSLNESIVSKYSTYFYYAVNLEDVLTANKDIIAKNNVSISKNLTVNGSTNLNGAIALNGRTTVNANISFSSSGSITLPDNSVNSNHIVDGSITTADIKDSAITEAKIANNAVTTNKIKDSAVTTAKINNSAVTTDKIANSAITSAKIANGSITADKLSTSSSSSFDFSTTVLPGSGNSIDLGSSSKKWRNVYSQNVYGNIIFTDTNGNVRTIGGVTQPIYISSGSATACTMTSSTRQWNAIPVTDGNGLTHIGNSLTFHGTQNSSSNTGTVSFNGSVFTFSHNVKANVFDGTAVRANWADLAEKYESDLGNYPNGTLVTFGGDKEITIATNEEDVCAVISSKPGYTLNNNSEGQIIALCGRVPVRVIGKVKKFDRIKLSNIDGVGIATKERSNVIARALEDKDFDEEGLVECVTLFRL